MRSELDTIAHDAIARARTKLHPGDEVVRVIRTIETDEFIVVIKTETIRKA